MPPKEDATLFLPREILLGYGCRNCVWKTYRQCPKGFTKENESVKEGYCDELVQFLFALGDGSNNINVVKEKFHLYIQEMQALADHAEYSRVKVKYDKYISEGGHSNEEISRLQMTLTSYKMWWSRLTETLVKGYSRINDREQRREDKNINVNQTISLNQIHQIASDAKKELEMKKDDM